MGCACKQREKLEKSINANNENYEKKGIFNLIKLSSISFINNSILILLLILLTPIVILIVIFNAIFRNKFTFLIPKSLIKFNKNQKE